MAPSSTSDAAPHCPVYKKTTGNQTIAMLGLYKKNINRGPIRLSLTVPNLFLMGPTYSDTDCPLPPLSPTTRNNKKKGGETITIQYPPTLRSLRAPVVALCPRSGKQPHERRFQPHACIQRALLHHTECSANVSIVVGTMPCFLLPPLGPPAWPRSPRKNPLSISCIARCRPS